MPWERVAPMPWWVKMKRRKLRSFADCCSCHSQNIYSVTLPDDVLGYATFPQDYSRNGRRDGVVVVVSKTKGRVYRLIALGQRTLLTFDQLPHLFDPKEHLSSRRISSKLQRRKDHDSRRYEVREAFESWLTLLHSWITSDLFSSNDSFSFLSFSLLYP